MTITGHKASVFTDVVKMVEIYDGRLSYVEEGTSVFTFSSADEKVGCKEALASLNMNVLIENHGLEMYVGM